MAKRSSVSRLIIMIVIAVTLFMGLALGEDYGRGLWARWQSKTVVTGAVSDIGKTVKRYDLILAKAYEQDKPSLLRPVATERQITKVRLYMTYEQVEEKRKMVTELKNLSIDKTEKKGNKATALTTETWEYFYKDLNTGKEFGRATESYNVTYSLVRTKGRWLVDSLDAKKI